MIKPLSYLNVADQKKTREPELEFNLETLKKIDFENQIIKETKSISDKSMRQIWRKILTYFIDSPITDEDFASVSSNDEACLFQSKITKEKVGFVEKSLSSTYTKLPVKENNTYNPYNDAQTAKSIRRQFSYYLRHI